MDERAAALQRFLAQSGWGDAARAPLAGDASLRRYERLRRGVDRAVLMDAPPAAGEEVRPFVRIARHLRGLGLSAPEIYAEDAAHGFLLLEDLGDGLFARIVRPETEAALYSAAVDVLVTLHQQPPMDLPQYDAAALSALAAPAFDWYRAGTRGPEPEARAAFIAALQAAFEAVPAEAPVMVLRDYHAENLIWRPERAGAARVGLLDFQDAQLGAATYDLVSLLEDARRDVPKPLQAAMRARYLAETGRDRDAFDLSYAVHGAQRNLRILGVFARLSLKLGRPAYVDFLPRVWGHVMQDLAHPALAALRQIVEESLPEPTSDHLATLKAKCGTLRTL